MAKPAKPPGIVGIIVVMGTNTPTDASTVVARTVYHADHGVTADHFDWVQAQLGDAQGFFLRSFKLPENLPDLQSALHGPSEGDLPVPSKECTFRCRNGRPVASRLCWRKPRPARHIVVVGVREENRLVFFTAYGSINGVPSPREPGDTSIDTWEGVLESRAFWAEHALSDG